MAAAEAGIAVRGWPLATNNIIAASLGLSKLAPAPTASPSGCAISAGAFASPTAAALCMAAFAIALNGTWRVADAGAVGNEQPITACFAPPPNVIALLPL